MGEDERAGGDADHPGLDDRADMDGRGDVMAIGERGERDVGAGDAEDDQRQQPFRAADVAGREHRLRKDHQDRAGDRRGDEGGEASPSQTTQTCGLSVVASCWARPRFSPIVASCAASSMTITA